MEFLMNLDWVNVIEALLMIVGAASILASMTPNPKDDEILKKANAVLNFLAANFGNAANKEDKKK